MQPVTPSPRRYGTQYVNPRARLSGDRTNGLMPPPLYYGGNVNNKNKNKFTPPTKEAPVRLVSAEGGIRHQGINRPGLSSSANSFMPVVSLEERTSMHSYRSFTPPASPYYQKAAMASPSPSLRSEATETTASESFCMSPSPSFPSSSYHRSSPYGSRTSTPTNYPRSPFSSRSSPTKRTSKSPAAFQEDATRKQRAKTEMCMHYEKGNRCPFGANCTYAHGVEELQMTKLMDLQRAGLIEDVETYRTKPCLTFVATGSCPFGKRCVGIHDPRVIGSTASWLPHTETQGNSINTDINVDGLHQKRLNTILHANPFGEQFSLDLDDWRDLYKLVCNTTSSNKRRRNALSEVHKLSIALQMRGGSGWMYKFRPQHVVSDTLCMVLQKRAFRLEKSGTATCIPLVGYKPNNPKHVLVRQIAFGPDSDPSVRGVALWFNIPESDVGICTPQQAKRYRWKKGPTKNEGTLVSEQSDSFDIRECFIMVRPHDPDAYELATKIIRHRFDTVQAESFSSLSKRFDCLKELAKEKEKLCQDFKNQRRHWIAWAWPMNTGRQTVDDDTPVPSIDGNYVPIIDRRETTLEDEQDVEPATGWAVQATWDAFVTTKFTEDPQARPEKEPPLTVSHTKRRRLQTFKQLAEGKSLSWNLDLPHIVSSAHTKLSSSVEEAQLRQSECCWKSLLLNQNESHGSNDEWDIVLEHFQNARCKKVLTIIQQ